MNDFKKEYSYFKKSVEIAIKRCLSSGWYILGPEVENFEKEFAKYIGTKYCVGVGNGLEALQISLLALGIGRDDEVLTVSNSAVATTLAITNTGAKPIFVDIDEFYHIDVTRIEEKITPKTKVIMPVHLFGQPVAIKELVALAEKHGLYIIEDACQAHGAAYQSQRVGSFGTFGCFSFYPTKNLGAYGDGGTIMTNSQELYKKCLSLRNYGQTNRYEHDILGLNSRLDEIQAAILRAKLPKLDQMLKERNSIARLYKKQLLGIPQIILPKTRKNNFHSFHLFVIQAEKRDALMNFLRSNGVQTLIHYPIPIHKQKCYKIFNSISLPRTEEFSKNILSLPIHPFMKKDEILTVTGLIKKFYEKLPEASQ
jgi:dTDP-4-amino-4,6-dideoxygalactose transaminase